MKRALPILKGRGTGLNPPNRFEPLHVEPDGDAIDADLADPDAPRAPAGIQTNYFIDSSKSIISTNDSPDVGFTHSVNPYRGCAHGCIYCYARPGHEYLGMSSGLDFESRIMVKPEAPRLLRVELSARSWRPTTLVFSGVTDCYQPVERQLCLTRRCIEVCRDFGNPVAIVTKNALVTRDLDLLGEMAARSLAMVLISVTTLDRDLSRIMEPRASAPSQRLQAIARLRAAGVPVGVMVAPVIPAITDQEIPAIIRAAGDAGAMFASYVVLRLSFAIKDLFDDWLARHFPDRREKVLSRIRQLRGGKLNDPEFRTRMRGTGVWADQIKSIFDLARRKTGLDHPVASSLRTDLFRVPAGPQMNLWAQ